jgi:hypothetical protein
MYTKFSFENLQELTWAADIYTEQTNVKMYVREIDCEILNWTELS